MDAIEPIKPLTPLYGSREQFEVSAAGLAAWRQSEAFARVVAFYKDYPRDRCRATEARALLHHLIVMRRPERALELGTYHAGTAEVMARGLLGGGPRASRDDRPFGGERCPLDQLPLCRRQLRERISFLARQLGLSFRQGDRQRRASMTWC